MIISICLDTQVLIQLDVCAHVFDNRAYMLRLLDGKMYVYMDV